MSDLEDRVAMSSTARARNKGQKMEVGCATREGYLSSKVFVKNNVVTSRDIPIEVGSISVLTKVRVPNFRPIDIKMEVLDNQ